MYPISDFERLPLSLRNQVRLDVDMANVLPWECYGIERRIGTTSKGERFPYYAEVGTASTMCLEDLGNEFFGNELQKVNVSRPDSVFRFCEKYGLPVAAGYDGAQRLAWYRLRHDNRAHPFIPVLETTDLYVSDYIADTVAPVALGHEEDVSSGFTPYLLSEEARRICLEDKQVVGAISEAEAIQTIRAMQTATALLTAVGMATQEPDVWGASAISEYLQSRSHMAQNGLDFFIGSSEDSLLKGFRFMPYDMRINRDERFREMVQDGEDAGFNTRAAYTSTLATGIVLSANECMHFLESSVRGYAAPVSMQRLGFSERERKDGASVWERIRDALTLRSEYAELFGSQQGTLSAAIIAQFASVYNDEAEWRVCQNCGRIFKKYREEKSGTTIHKTRFCKRSCANQYSKKRSEGLITEQSV